MVRTALSAAIAAVAALGLVACSEPETVSGKPPRPSAPPPATSPPDAAPVTISIEDARKLPATEFETVGNIVFDLPLAEGKPQGVRAVKVMADGTILGIAMNTTMDWHLGDPSSIVAVDPRTGEVETLVRDDERTPGTAMNDTDMDEQFVVWADSASADLYTDPWTLMSKSRRTGEVAVLGQAPAGHDGADPSTFYHGSYP